MNTAANESLHDIHTATNDMLKGYREMAERAQPDIQPVIRRLITLHETHAVEQEAELARSAEAGHDDTSFQGTINKAVVIVRDWVTDLDRDALPAVRQGEEALCKQYDKALTDPQLQSRTPLVTLLRSQLESIRSAVAQLPRD